MSVIHFRRMGRLPSADSYPSPGRGESFRRDIPDDERGIKFEIDRMVKYVKDFRADPVVVKTARRVVQLCQAKDKHCEMAALFTWTKGHFRYVNDPVNAEAIQTPPSQIAEILTPPDVIRAVLGDELIQQMSGFGIGGAVLAAPNQLLARGCFRESLAGPMWHKTSGDCDEGCLHPDEKLWVRINGAISRVAVKSLVGHFVPVASKKSLVTTTGDVDAVADSTFMAESAGSAIEILSVAGNSHRLARPVWRKVVGLYHRIAPVDLVEITISGGQTLRCTENHLVYRNTSKSFVPARAGNVQAGDCVVGVNGMPSSAMGDMPVTEEDLFFLGFWIADGCYDSQHGPKFSCGNDAALVGRVREWASSKKARDGAAKSSVSRSRIGDVLIHSRWLMSWMKELGFSGFSDTKHAPEWVFGLPDNGIAAFLRGYFTGDGSIHKDNRGFTRISSTSVNRELSRDIRDLLFRLSIRATVHQSRHRGGYGPAGWMYPVTVSARNSVERFLSVVGNFRDVSVSLRQIGKSVYQTSWRTVQSVKKIRADEVFDLEVERDHVSGISPDNGSVYVVGGLLTHNSTFLATMLAAIGITSRFQFGGSVDGDGKTPNWHHVWTGGYDESSGKWIDMDITEERSNLGWRYPNFLAYGHVPIFSR